MTTSYLNELFTKIWKDAWSPETIIFEVATKRLEKYGIHLSEIQVLKLHEQITNPSVDGIRIQLTNEQEDALVGTGAESSPQLTIDLSDIDFSEEKLETIAGSLLDQFLKTTSDLILDDWKLKITSVLAQENEERAAFGEKIREIWGVTFDQLDALVSICTEFGAEFNDEFRHQCPENQLLLAEALTRLHARGCQVATEIVTLLRNGFADGAHARWRTLHEVTTIAQFIAEHGNELAGRYLDHSVVSALKQYKEYSQHYQSIGYVAPEQSDGTKLQKAFDNIIQRYGNSFGADYGWAANILKHPNFKIIEQAVSASHMRPFYMLANMNIHADSRSTSFRLGMPPSNDQILLSGSSIFGLGEPAQNTAYSVNLLTGTLLLIRPNIDRLAFVSATGKLVNEIFWAIDEIMHKQESMDCQK